jgi:hypothetical protein
VFGGLDGAGDQLIGGGEKIIEPGAQMAGEVLIRPASITGSVSRDIA